VAEPRRDRPAGRSAGAGVRSPAQGRGPKSSASVNGRQRSASGNGQQRGSSHRTSTASKTSEREPSSARREGQVEEAQVAGWLPIATFILSIIGFGISVYLTIDHYTGNKFLVCSASSVVNCQKVTTSPESMVFGVFPVALLGLIFFTFMVPLNFPKVWRSRLWWVSWGRLAMVVGGIGFVVYLLYSELFSIKAICLWCTGVHAITFILFVLVLSTISSLPPLPSRDR